MFLVVIALDSHHGNSRFLQQTQAGKSIVHRLGRDGPLVEEIAAHKYEIDLFFDSESMQHIDPRIEKVPWTFGQLVPRAAEMHIGNVEEFH